ncbi:hypothetical protein [Methylococcus sp. EFPC2]|uniref:hypothetical protein n=1 Tax=Methylococcus sp. EFPC2 TaxID=2812648 RepID=UPI0019675547|nr:hypothetical protein [Methylococcus sp. EFPC2]QSA97483.1 hypothetical protein JWZ97_01140 [Methylococcus sp. EFPC2]
MTNPIIALYFLSALQWAGTGAQPSTASTSFHHGGDGSNRKQSRMPANENHPLARVEPQLPLTDAVGFGTGRRNATAESSPTFAAENLPTDHNGDANVGNTGKTSHPDQIEGIPVKKIPGDWLDGHPRN